jgi:hypothetical protein
VEAVPWFDDALACAEAHFGPQSETVKTVREDFVHVLLDAGAQTQSRGDTANAENCYNRATSLAHALPDEVLEATAMTNRAREGGWEAARLGITSSLLLPAFETPTGSRPAGACGQGGSALRWAIKQPRLPRLQRPLLLAEEIRLRLASALAPLNS